MDTHNTRVGSPPDLNRRTGRTRSRAPHHSKRQGTPRARADLPPPLLDGSILHRRRTEILSLLDLLPAYAWISLDPDGRIVRGNRLANGLADPGDIFEAPTCWPAPVRMLTEDGTPCDPGALPLRRALAQRLPVRDVFVCFVLADGREIPTLASATPLFDAAGELAGAVAVCLDITERAETEVAWFNAIRALRAISAGNDLILRAVDETDLFREVCHSIVNLGGYRLAWVGLAACDPRRTLRAVAHAGCTAQEFAKLRSTCDTCPRKRCALGTAVRTRRPVLIRDAMRLPPRHSCVRILRKLHCASTLTLPLTVDGLGIGLLCIYAASRTAFTPDAIDLLTRLAANLAFGVQSLRSRQARLRLERQLQEISEREQRRLGQDLHDGPTQRLVGARLRCEAIAARVAGSMAPVARDLRGIVRELEEVREELRQIARGLLPIHPGAHCLAGALQDLATHTTRTFRIPCRFHSTGQPQVADPEAAAHLYRIAQEAAHNAARHGHPSHIRIDLAAVRGGVRLRVVDDGCGLPDATGAGAGLGMDIMRYRASLIGAILAIAPRRGCGTTVSCAWGTTPTHCSQPAPAPSSRNP